MKIESEEQHPNFQSGEYTGFYNYANIKFLKDSMSCSLSFSKGSVSGAGSDSVGSFVWSGSYDTELGKVYMTKSYLGAHTVEYKGTSDENGIWGTWHIGEGYQGGFHIWINNRKSSETVEEDEVDALLEQIVQKHFAEV